MRDPSPGSIILLNGASSAGKSTLARALQAQMEGPFLCFSLDLFLFDGKVLPKRRDHDGPYSWPVMRPLLFEGYFRCLGALAGAGNNLIVDYIIETHDQMNRLASLTAPFDVFYVGVDCPLPELERRERERGDRKTGDARRDHANFQTFGPYDVKVDATLPADANASSLARLWKERLPPGVFRAKARQA